MSLSKVFNFPRASTTKEAFVMLRVAAEYLSDSLAAQPNKEAFNFAPEIWLLAGWVKGHCFEIDRLAEIEKGGGL